MQRSSVLVAVSILSAMLMTSSAKLQAAELKALIGGAMAEIFKELGPQFERASGHKLVIFYGTTPNLIKQATSGEPFDVGVVPVDVMRDGAARSKFAGAPTTDIARVGLGVAVRAGASKPDIRTPEALKQALLKARSVAFIPQSAGGSQVLRLFDRLDISDAMKAKTKPQATPPQIAQAVATGDAELGIFLANVLIAPGVELVGPFPAELQEEVVFTGAVSASTAQAEAARALIDYLKTPGATAIIRAKGMQPG
ncbi:MAG TPA: substrate-binding domain-containing protein [Burkholderiales bacterium]|nr:substrate-binding domain-containing protein [Burkholderiales bacterium]